MDVSLKHPFSMIVSGERCAVKTEFTKKLLKRKLIAPPSKSTVWCYAKHQQDLFWELMKMNVEYVEGIPSELNSYFHQNKRNLIILHDMKAEASNSVTITQQFTRGHHDNLFVI